MVAKCRPCLYVTAANRFLGTTTTTRVTDLYPYPPKVKQPLYELICDSRHVFNDVTTHVSHLWCPRDSHGYGIGEHEGRHHASRDRVWSDKAHGDTHVPLIPRQQVLSPHRDQIVTSTCALTNSSSCQLVPRTQKSRSLCWESRAVEASLS